MAVTLMIVGFALLAGMTAWLLLRGAKTETDSPLLVLARTLTAEQDTRWPERDGEAKRHQVYARLRKDFPETQKRAISRAIEDALGD